MSSDPAPASPEQPATEQPGAVATIALAWLVRAVPLAVLGLVLAIVIPGVPWWIGPIVGAAVAAVRVWLVLRSAARWLLGTIGASEADARTNARLLNLVQGLSLAGGTGEPDVHVVDRPGRNAAAVDGGETTAIVVTTGLLDTVDRVALEAVVAEALVRIGNGDARRATQGAALFSPLLGGPLAGLTAPIGRVGLRRMLGAERELLADRDAIALTRYPPGLATALGAVRDGSAVVDDVPDTLDHIWFVPPTSVGDRPVDDRTVTPLDLRIDVLGEF